jgi:poly-gamma-glutamate capsule biosynthesis protein CapA/YwtB (metallophosphatase superfamily)
MRVVFCGEMLFSSRNLAKRLDPRIVKLLQEADAVLTNGEFCTPKRDTPPGLCMFLTAVREDTLDELVDLNIRLVSFANNHIGDFGWQGALDTMEAAECRGLIACGVGRNLKDARKARFLDTAKGRVAVVAADTTWANRSLASDAGADVVARPGLCPLRWGSAYVLPEKEFQDLKHIDEILGTRQAMRETSKIETWDYLDGDTFKFGSPMEGSLLIEKGETACVRTFVNEEDQEALLTSIRDAAKRSDLVVATIHSHEGMGENWYNPEPPEFVVEYAHKAIDAGASIFVGQGAHYFRGAEIYKGKPIFYNLGNFLMEFEAGETIISPEMYRTYHLGENAHPSDLHGGRCKDAEGNWLGFYSERRFSQHFLVVLDMNGKDISYHLVPLDLNMRRENNLQRGLPVIMDAAAGLDFAECLNRVSVHFNTEFEYLSDGTIRMRERERR